MDKQHYAADTASVTVMDKRAEEEAQYVHNERRR